MVEAPVVYRAADLLLFFLPCRRKTVIIQEKIETDLIHGMG